MRYVLIALVLAGCAAKPPLTEPVTISRGASLDLNPSGQAASPPVVVVQTPAAVAPPPLVLNTYRLPTAPVYVPPMRPLLTCNTIGGATFCN